MADEPVRTEVRTDDGWLEFQDYFVRLRQAPDVREVRFAGIEAARPTPEVAAAIEAADVIVIAPSNPIVSVGPILAVPGLAELLAAARGARRPDRRGQRDHRRQGAQGPGRPDARLARPRGDGARRRPRLRRADRRLRPGHGRRGARRRRSRRSGSGPS